MYIILDCSYLCHVAKHAMGELLWEEKRVGIIFGFLRQLLSIAKHFESNDFIFAWDSKESKRKQIFPEYKANRHSEKTIEEKELDAIAYAQFTEIREKVLPYLDVHNNFMIRGFEADDIIAQITRKHTESEFVIVSSDSDLYQLLETNRVTIYSIKKKEIFNWASFVKEYDILPSAWQTVKAIAGCVSDGVPGVAGVGEKTAIKYLNGELKDTTTAYAKIRDFQDLYRNRQLVTLPYPGMPLLKISKQGKLPLLRFLDICRDYGFESFVKKDNLDQWKKYLKLV